MEPVIFFLLILQLAATTTAVLHPSDFLALQSLRSSLHDLPNSTFFSTWDFTADDPCSSFSGVLCSSTSRIISLTLGSPAAGSPGLSGHLPSSLSLLSSLLSLSLLPGHVTGPLPLLLPPSLRFLALSHNSLSGPIPSLPPNLQTLDLSFNLLSGPIPHRLPRNLQTLILSHNRLSGPIPPLPQSLTHLSLKFNRISGPIPQTVLRNLVFLDLSYNRIDGTVPKSVFSVAKWIYLQGNRLSGKVRVEGEVGAREVDLSHNGLWGEVPEGLAGAERVYLNGNGFTGSVGRRFTERVRSGELKVLYLQRNYLTGFDGGIEGNGEVCLHYNCMEVPRGVVCPVRKGRWQRRPVRECRGWRKGK